MKSADFERAVLTIIDGGEEGRAISILLQSMSNRLQSMKNEVSECRAALRAIQKINAGNDGAIDALCDHK